MACNINVYMYIRNINVYTSVLCTNTCICYFYYFKQLLLLLLFSYAVPGVYFLHFLVEAESTSGCGPAVHFLPRARKPAGQRTSCEDASL